MKIVVDYSKTVCPQFDAVNDIMDYLDDRYELLAGEMQKVRDQNQFACLCSFMGIHGFPVKAWFNHFFGGDAWKDAD